MSGNALTKLAFLEARLISARGNFIMEGSLQPPAIRSSKTGLVYPSGGRFTLGARLSLAAACLLCVWAVVGLAYFFDLPTDGWLAGGLSQPFVLTRDFSGLVVGLQPGDRLVAIDGYQLNNNQAIPDLAPAWQAESTLLYTLTRDGVTREVPVTLGRWTPAAATTVFFNQNGGFWGELIFWVMAVFTFFKRPADHAAQGLFLLSTALISLGSLSLLVMAFPVSGILPWPRSLFYATIILLYTLIGPPILIRLALVFPHPKQVAQRFPFLETLPFLVGLVMIPVFLLTDGAAGFAWTIVSVLLTIGLLIHNAFTMRDAYSRAQLLWGLWGMVTGLVMFLSSMLVKFGLVTGFLGDLLTFFSNLSFGVIGATLSVAILRYRLFDISLIVRRTVQYAILTVLLSLVYLGSVLLLQQLFHSLTGQRSDLALVFSTLLIASLFTPLRRRVQGFIDRRFYRKKYDAGRILEEFSSSARGEMELDQLTGQLVDVVEQTVQPEGVSLWIRDNKRS
jgi:hypothetical protein